MTNGLISLGKKEIDIVVAYGFHACHSSKKLLCLKAITFLNSQWPLSSMGYDIDDLT